MSFYGWLWRILPGPMPVKVIGALTLLTAVLAVLFTLVFPAIAPLMPFNETTVE